MRECLRLLYQASRTFPLATLQPEIALHDTLGLSAPTQVDAAAGFQALSPEDTERPFSSLAAGKAMLKLNASALSTGTAAPHYQMVKVRLRGIRCWLHGYRVCDSADADGLVHVQLTHTGDSMYVIDAEGTTDSRTHEPITRDLICNAVATGTNDDYQTTTDKSLHGVKDAILIDGTNTYTLSNPFATWQITFPYVSTDPHNALYDASDLTAIHLEFFIDYDDVKRG